MSEYRSAVDAILIAYECDHVGCDGDVLPTMQMVGDRMEHKCVKCNRKVNLKAVYPQVTLGSMDRSN